MDRLIKAIDEMRAKLENLRKRSLKETPTRTIVIDPLLEALGWDVRDPDEVLLEYPTVDSKSVDYALLINRKPVLLVEAKPLDDPLNDVKGITQVVGYAANDGIVWCVLTNGVVWKVYRSVEQCPAPEKLMFEVSLDPRAREGLSVEQIACQMWRFSREEMAKGRLDAIGEQTFTDGKVRKALDRIMRDAPRMLLNLVRATVGEEQLTTHRIKQSLSRIWTENTGTTPAITPLQPGIEPVPDQSTTTSGAGSIRARKTPGARATRKPDAYKESDHTANMPQEVIELYRAVDRLCLSLKPGEIERRCMAMTINYTRTGRIFCCVSLLKGGLRVWLKLKLSRLDSPPSFARDVSSVGHYGAGDLELAISSVTQLDEAAALIRRSFESVQET